MACVDLQFMCLCRPAPLCADELRLVESEGLAACRLPTQTGFCEPALARLLREVEVDVVKGLPGSCVRLAGKFDTPRIAARDCVAHVVDVTVGCAGVCSRATYMMREVV